MTITPNWKPAKHSGKAERRVRKDKRQAIIAQAKKRQRLDKAKAYQLVRLQVFTREKGCCRAFGDALYFEHPDPHRVGHCHHVIYKSAGGNDTVDNLIFVSWKAHTMIHEGLLDVSGDPNGFIYFTQKNRKGQIVKTWESQA